MKTRYFLETLMRRLAVFLVISLLVAPFAVVPTASFAYYTTQQAADVVLGQPGFTANAAGTTDDTLRGPTSVAVDAASGKVFVADAANNRVLRYGSAAAAASGSVAEAVLGQADFTSSGANRDGDVAGHTLSAPQGVFVHDDQLWVSDAGNHRVLRFDAASSFTSGISATLVLGQTDLLTNTAGVAADRMNSPAGLFVDGNGTLWVADAGNHRVIRFDGAATLSNGSAADGVLGQADFASSSASAGQGGMHTPRAITADTAGTLWVTDMDNHRVLRFDKAASKTNGAGSDGVLGQADYSSTSANRNSSANASSLHSPDGLALDDAGRLYVADRANNRILVFAHAVAKADGAAADDVLGQPDFGTITANSSGITAKTLYQPGNLLFDGTQDKLWVADRDNNRVLRYAPDQPAPGGVADSLQLWLKAGSGSEMADGSAATSGDRVAIWQDQSAQNRDASQATASSQPVLQEGQLNFQPVLRFDGMDDSLQTELDIAAQTLDKIMVFAVVQGRDGAIWANSDGDDDRLLREDPSANAFIMTSSTGEKKFFNPLEEGTPLLTTAYNDAGAADASWLRLNGVQIGSLFTQSDVPTSALSLAIGATPDARYHLDGDIAEVIVYGWGASGEPLSDKQRLRIESYLALKYGITLDCTSNYVAADDTPVYPCTAGGTHEEYTYGIAGIGRDDAAGLNQLVGQALSADAVTVTMEHATAFDADGSFLTWGHNGETSRYNVLVTGETVAHMNRVWKVNKVGTVGRVTVKVSRNAAASHLWVDNNAFFSSAEKIPLQVEDDELVATVDFADDAYFTFAAPTPGGVATKLRVWMKADTNVIASSGEITSSGEMTSTAIFTHTLPMTITAWNDANGSGQNPSVAGAPQLVDDALNFYPVVHFNPTDGSDDYFTWEQVTAGWTSGEIFYVLKSDRSSTEANGFASWGNDLDNHYAWSDQHVLDSFGSSNGHVFTPSWDITQPVIYNTRAQSGDWSAWVNGKLAYTSSSNSVNFSGAQTNLGWGNRAGTFFAGDVAEVILFDQELNEAERSRVTAYLAVKYGLTLDSTVDYIAADGITTIYPSTGTHADFTHNIAGIGRDDTSGLQQLQARSASADALVTIATDTPLSSDKSFLLWGDNGRDALYGVQAGTHTHMNRIWRVKETGIVGTVSISLPLSSRATQLWVHDTTDFLLTAPRKIDLQSEGDALAATTDFADGQYFTFATTNSMTPVLVAPGAVVIDETDGLCSLREAIVNTNDDAQTYADCATGKGADTIELAAGSTYTINDVDNFWYGPNGLPPIVGPLVIEGNGSIIERDSAALPERLRFFYVGGDPTMFCSPGHALGNLTLRELTLRNGRQQGGDSSVDGGGGAGMGGAIFNQGYLTLERTTLYGNRATGGRSGVAAEAGTSAGGGMGEDAQGFAGGGFGGSFQAPQCSQGGRGDSKGGGGGGFAPEDDGVAGAAGAHGGGVNDGMGGPGAGFGGNGGAGSGGGGESGSGDGGGFGQGGFAVAGGGGVGGGGGSNNRGGGGGFGGGGGGSAAGFAGGSGGFGGGGGDSGGKAGFGGGTSTGSEQQGGGGAGMGGAIFNFSGVVTLTNSTLSGNTAQGGDGGNGGDGASGFGAALFNLNGSVVLQNSSLLSNTVVAGSGGADNSAGSAAGGALYTLAYDGSQAVSATVTLRNSILANTDGGNDLVADQPTNVSNGAPNKASGAVFAQGANLVESHSGVINGTVLEEDPKVSDLQDNGGPTWTHALRGGSPAVDSGENAWVPAWIQTDQRGSGFARILSGDGDQEAVVDLGALEFPATPSRPNMLADSDTGRDSSDNITSNTMPAFDGTAMPSVTVRLLVDNTLVVTTTKVVTTTSDDTGKWSVGLAEPLSDGTYMLTVRVIDAGGVESNASEGLRIRIDTQPSTSTPPNLLDKSDSGSSKQDNITNVDQPGFDGWVEVGSSVTLYAGALELGSFLTTRGGRWVVTSQPVLRSGEYTVTARAIDTAGNVGDFSDPLTMTVDTFPPVPPEIDGAEDGALEGENQLVLAGTAEQSSTVTLILDSKEIGTVQADINGAWFFDYREVVLNGGVYQLEAIATDVAGNSSESTFVDIIIGNFTPLPDSAADLFVSTAVQQATFHPGSLVEYRIVYANTGGAAVKGVLLIDTLPQQMTFVGALPSPANEHTVELVQSGATTGWRVDELAAGEYGVILLRGRIAEEAVAGDTLTNEVEISSDSGESITSNNTAMHTEQVVALEQAVLADVAVATWATSAAWTGGLLHYTVRYWNGTAVPLASVVVSDTLPAGVSFVQASHDGVYQDGAVAWSLPFVDAYQSGLLSVTVRVDDGVETGIALRNSVEARTPHEEVSKQNNQASSTTSVGAQPGSMSGTVTGPDGMPIVSARVLAYRQVNGQWKKQHTYTDGDGRYVFAQLEPDVYRIRVRDAASRYRTTYYADGLVFADATEVRVTSGEEAGGVDVQFQPPALPLATVAITYGHAYNRADTGELLINMFRDRSRYEPLTITQYVECSGGAPQNVKLQLVPTSGMTIELPMMLAGAAALRDRTWVYTTSIATVLQQEGTLRAVASCPEGVRQTRVGEIGLLDPSGTVTDARSGETIEGAKVELFRLPDWRPRSRLADVGAMTCDTVVTRDPYLSWNAMEAALVEQGVPGDPDADPQEMEPRFNPQMTEANGWYGWDVTEGCWYVSVQAEGYQPRISPAVGVPPEVTDLHLSLVPTGTASVQFSTSRFAVVEGSESAVVDVTLSQPVADAVRVDYATADGWAKVGVDYLFANGTLEFAAGETRKRITVPIGDDEEIEGSEFVNLRLSNAQGAVLGGTSFATLTIVDNDVVVEEEKPGLYLPVVRQ